MLHRRSPLLVALTLIVFVAVVGSARAASGQTTSSPPDSTEGPPGSPTSTTLVPCAHNAAVVAVFTGEPTGSEDDSLVFEAIDVESGELSEPVTVEYPDGLPIYEGLGPLRVEVFESDTGLRSEVECGGTTTIDGELLEADDDRLAALARTAGDLSQRAGRWALTGSLVLFAVVAALTLYRRWRPRLW